MAFKVDVKTGYFKPGDPMARDRFSMGTVIGNDLMVLYREFTHIKDFEIVDMETGDTMFITRDNKEDELEQLKHDNNILCKKIRQYEDALVKIQNAKGSKTIIDAVIASL